jgi:hypothetical protein
MNHQPIDNSYTCAVCGEVFHRGPNYSEEKAIKTYESAFGVNYNPEEVSDVCEDCYQLVMQYLATNQ